MPEPAVSDFETPLIAAAGEAPWLPSMAEGLARREWHALAARIGLSSPEYSTSRVLAGSASTARQVAGRLMTPATFGRNQPVLLEDLYPCDAYDGIGLSLASLRDPVAAADAARRLAGAFEVVAEVPSLAKAVGGVLSAVHVIHTPDPDTDVSFSDPAVPFSAFVGVPDADGHVASLRLAEGLVHEAMHLQLTLLENVLPLVAGELEGHWSPWQRKVRPTRGVLHGYYVFRVLDAFFTQLLIRETVASETALHLIRRRQDIVVETGSALATLFRSKELTAFGRKLLETLSEQDAVSR